MVDTDFEAMLEGRLNGYLTKEEFEERWANYAREQESRWVRMSTDNHRFIDSNDRYLRDTENRITLLIERMEMMIETGRDNFKLRAEIMDRQNDTVKDHDDRINRLEIGQAEILKSQQNLYDALFGNASHPDAPPSIYAIYREQSVQQDKNNKEVLGAIEKLSTRISDIESFVRNARRAYLVSNKLFGRVFKFALQTMIGRIISAAAAFYITARALDPAAVDKFVEEVVRGILALFGISV